MRPATPTAGKAASGLPSSHGGCKIAPTIGQLQAVGPRRSAAMGSRIDIRPIAGSIGAEIHGIDLDRELGDSDIAAIRKAWLEHCVIFFRDQPLPPARFLAFARRFGNIVEYPFIKGIEGFPEIIPV